MGKMKDLYIDKINEQGPDDIDWNAPTYDGAGFTETDRLAPPPIEIDIQTGLCKWVINDINVYAHTYEGALKVYNEIIDYGHSHTC